MRNLVATLALAALASPAAAYVASNGLIVKPQGADDFMVPYHGLSGAPDFWCAAGDYAIVHLHVSPGSRIYRTTGHRHAGQGIGFSLSPEGAQKSGIFVTGSPDKGVSATLAQTLCPSLQDKIEP